MSFTQDGKRHPVPVAAGVGRNGAGELNDAGIECRRTAASTPQLYVPPASVVQYHLKGTCGSQRLGLKSRRPVTIPWHPQQCERFGDGKSP